MTLRAGTCHSPMTVTTPAASSTDHQAEELGGHCQWLGHRDSLPLSRIVPGGRQQSTYNF